jgi:Fe-S cluster assembly protein SufD
MTGSRPRLALARRGKVTGISLERFGVSEHDGPAWLAPRRLQALESFRSWGFPTTRDEDWHFTNPGPIAEAALEPMAAPAGVVTGADVEAQLLGLRDAPRLVFVNGRHVPALSRLAGLEAGLRVMSLAGALHEEPTLLEAFLDRIAVADHPAQAFTALNTAGFRDGALVHIAKGVSAQQPVQLLFIADRAARGGVVHPRVLVVAEEGARLSVIEQYLALGGTQYFTNAVTELDIGPGATVEHLRLQLEDRSAFHVGSAVARQARDSHLFSFSFLTGAQLSRVNIYTTLAGPRCGAALNGLYMLDGSQHGDHQTRIEHAQPECYSREVYKGILDGSSHGVFNGKVYVHPVAQKTDGKQTNNALLLSERARVDTKPQLEIFADDVKCTHGATVGRLDEAARFYMRSRGIPDRETRKLLTYAFAAEVLETIPLQPLREALERLTLARFTEGSA